MPRKRNRRKGAAEGGWSLPFIGALGITFTGEEGRPGRRAASIVGFCAAVLVIGYGLVFAIDRPIQKVNVAGRFQRVTPTQVQEAVTRALKDDSADTGILSVDLEQVRQ